jgi:hypothetical protein
MQTNAIEANPVFLNTKIFFDLITLEPSSFDFTLIDAEHNV